METNQPCKRRRRSASEIRDLLDRYRQSQVTQAEFALAEGLSLATLARHLRRDKLTRPSLTPRGFLEISSANAFDPGAGPDPFRIWLRGDVRLEVPQGFRAAEVANLLSVLAEMGAA